MQRLRRRRLQWQLQRLQRLSLSIEMIRKGRGLEVSARALFQNKKLALDNIGNSERKRVIGMELTSAHLRYLLAIYEVSQTHLDISSRSIAEKLGVTKPSVVRIMNLLMERGMIVKEHYGKIYMTDRGIWVAKQVDRELKTILTHFPPVSEPLSEEERFTAALAMTSALPERIFTGEYERLFGSDAEKAETEKAQ